MPNEAEFSSAGSWGRLLRWARSRGFEVADRSMAPTLEPGDRLLVDPREFRTRLPRTGEIVVTRDPALPSRHLVKRVGYVPGGPAPPGGGAVPAGSVYLIGDAPEASRDSRTFGPVSLTLLVGRAYEIYRPPARRRPL